MSHFGRSAKNATEAIPVIMATMGDPRAGAPAEGLRVRLVRREGVRAADFGPMASRTPRAASRGWRNCAQWFRGMPRHGSLLFFAVLLVACAQSPVQPTTACAGTHTLYVVSHGWHSGIVVDRAELVQRVPALAADIGQDGYVEVGWGEVHFYRQEKRTRSWRSRGLRPNAAVLQVVPFAEAPRRYFAQSEVWRSDRRGGLRTCARFHRRDLQAGATTPWPEPLRQRLVLRGRRLLPPFQHLQ